MRKIAGKSALLLCFLLLLCGGVAAQSEPLVKQYSYRHYTTRDGLPSNMNDNIIQDGDGFIWIAGPSGLTRFDGFSFTNFAEGRDVVINRLDHDSTGHVRAFSRNIMYTVDENGELQETVPDEDKYMTYPLSLVLPDGYGIYNNRDGTQQALYSIGDGGKQEKILEHPLLTDFDTNYQAFYDDETGELYLFGEYETTLISRDGVATPSMEGLYARTACKWNGALYVVGLKGIYRLENSKATPLIEPDVDIDIHIWPYKVIADRQGVLYFNAGGLLCRFDGRTIETIFSANVIKDFIIDNEDNLWVTTYQGVYNLFGMKFENYTLPDPTDVVRNVIYNPERESIFAATLNGNIYEIWRDGNVTETVQPENPYGVAFFYDYAAEKEGALYFPGPGDILKIDGGERRWLGLPFFDTPIFVQKLPNGNLLEGGVWWMIEFTPDGKVVKNFDERTIQQQIVAKPCFDARGRLWFGGSNGVTIYDYDKHEVVKTIFTDSIRIVRHLANDGEGNVWFASENRLYVSVGDSVRLERTFPKLIGGIYFTRRDNRLVVPAQDGFYLFDKDRRDYLFFNHENGYTGEESSSGAVAEDADGNIYIPSLAGLFRFDPDELTSTSAPPRLHILSTLSSTDNVEWRKFESGETKLGWRHRNVRFEHIGISYSSAQSVRYCYRLVGFQDVWSEPTPIREVTFNNLPPGDYTFEIYAEAGMGEARSDVAAISFEINPALWQRAWFMAAIVIFLTAGSAGVAMTILRRRNCALLEKLRAEKELNELRISSIRLKAIPHFNANVLAAIEYYIANRTKEEAMRILGIYSDFTLKTLSEVDRASRSLNEELAYVKMYLDLEKIRFMEKFDFRIETDEGVDPDVQLPNMILHTYCENAVKHGLMPLKSGGALTIRVSQHGGKVSVSVEDNGVGRVHAAANPHLHSTKHGLSILDRQIEIYNSFNDEKISQRIDDLSSEEGRPAGTRFSVEVPVNFTYIS
jgi:ligand-binding sensor domain-containing protein